MLSPALRGAGKVPVNHHPATPAVVEAGAGRWLGAPVLIADIRLTETLETLHVAQARSLVVVTSSDTVNVGCQAEGSTVAHLEEHTQSRVLLLTADGRQHCRPSGDWTLTAGQELVVVVTRSGRARPGQHRGGAHQPSPQGTAASVSATD